MKIKQQNGCYDYTILSNRTIILFYSFDFIFEIIFHKLHKQILYQNSIESQEFLRRTPD